MKTYFFLIITFFAGLMMVVSLNSCTEEVTKNEELSPDTTLEDFTIEDFSKAIQINRNDTYAYHNRRIAEVLLLWETDSL